MMNYALPYIVRILRTKQFYFFVVLVLLDQIFYSTFSNWRRQSEKNQQSLTSSEKPYKRITIDDLMAKKNIPFDSVAKLPNRDLSRTEEKNAFSYRRIKCPRINKIVGDSNNFKLCWPIRAAEPDRLAYFINVHRDFRFESNFKAMVGESVSLKIFTKHRSNSMVDLEPKADFVKYVDVKIFTNKVNDEEMGIKDLIDLHDDYHKMEFMMYEMDVKTDPIVFSINIPVFSSHILLRLHDFDYEEVRYVVKRLNYATYYPYSLEVSPDRRTLFIAFMHKHSLNKYDAELIFDAKWNKEGSSGLEDA